MMERIVIYKPGQIANLSLPGAYDFEVRIDSVRIDAAGSVVYLVGYFDGDLRRFWVDADCLDANTKIIVNAKKIQG